MYPMHSNKEFVKSKSESKTAFDAENGIKIYDVKTDGPLSPSDDIQLDNYSYLGYGEVIDRAEIIDFFNDEGLKIPSLPVTDYTAIAPLVDAYFRFWSTMRNEEYGWIKSKSIFVVLFDSLIDSSAKPLIENIDLNKIEDLQKIYLLEELVRVMQVRYSRQIGEAKKLILEKVEQSTGSDNYLIATLLKSIVRDQFYTPESVQLDDDKESVFEISKGQYATVDFETASLRVLQDKETIAYFDKDKEHLKFNSFMVGDDESRDIFDLYPEVEANLILDYIKLCQARSRALFESEFQISFKNLTIKEQIYFLDYLKHTSLSDVETMKTFIAHYGIDAMRSFLANSYDENAAENIMIFGTMIEPETAGKVFSSYASSIDSTTKFGALITEGIDDDTEVCKLVSELEEGMIKRAGHLFEAGKQMAMWEYSGEESTTDLVAGYEGVATISKVLANLGDEKVMKIVSHQIEKGGDQTMKTFKLSLEDKESGFPYSLKVSIRSEASTQGEARINFELSLDGLPEENELKIAFQQTTQFKGKNGKNARTVSGSVIRFGFDLDARTDPPTFSFDMGRSAYTNDDMERTGDVLGRILSQVAPTGHHLQDFDRSLSNPENFKKIAESFLQHFEKLNTTVVGGR